jgi:asparagine synthase (glutamine-hydrolysing)
MCGIAGAIALSPEARVDLARVQRMSRLIAHRGPDEQGYWTDPAGRIALAHRRLSIIDLSTGQQPMTDPATGQVLIFNGEIYNYVELRSELEQRGVTFTTRSDTEVLLRVLQQDGEEGVQRLRGMFAFAFYDPAAHRLLLARDHLGKKPVYHAVERGCLYFASTFRAIAATAPEVTPEADVVDTFLDLGYIPSPRTIDAHIRKLPAASLLRAEGGTVAERSYWSPLEDRAPFEGSFIDAVDRLDELLGEAVDIRLRSDVPLGVFLSGGIDSSLIAAIASRRAARGVLTFSIGFDEERFDESAYAADVARRIGAEHRVFHTPYGALELLPELVRHFGEPFGDSSAIPTWQLARETRRHVTVAVGGDGGDEGFGGYNWYRTAATLSRLRRAVPAGMAAAGNFLLSAGSGIPGMGRFHRGAAILSLDEPDRFAALRGFIDDREASRLYAGALAHARATADARGRDLLADAYRAGGGTALRRMRAVDVTTYLADDLMAKVDIATMAHGLEARAPLLDRDVVEFALSLPDEWITDARTGKKLLRALLARYLPAELFDRPKQGFSVPLQTWFAGELRPLLDALPRSAPLMDTGWFRPAGIRALIDEHAAGRRDHSHRLYNLLVLDEWLRQH